MAKGKAGAGGGSGAAASAAVDAQLARLAALRSNPTAPESIQDLKKALGGKTSLAAAKAADIIREARLLDLVPDLAAAFERFMTAADKGCAAKTAIARALDVLETSERDVFLRGVRHVQMEPVWGGSADAAVELRGICAAGLARTNYPQITWELAHLLADPDPSARMAAARAIAHAGRDEGAALLAMKIRLGDTEPAVTAECLAALLRLAPAKGVDVAAPFLDHADDELRTAALMALGESRRPEALKLLRQRYEAELNVAKRGPLLLPIALTRQPEAIEFLVTIVDEERPSVAAEAVAALATFRGDETVRARVEGIVNDRNEPDLRAAFEKHFVRSR